VDAAERKEILSRYMDHTRRFEAVAARRANGNAEVIPFTAPLKELEQEPTAREVEVLQLISDGLVNREIGQRLFLSEETVKSQTTCSPSCRPVRAPTQLLSASAAA
jgi:DNA-binding NarL/FixJ family response regulator